MIKRKQKDEGYNIMIGPLQPCEAMLGFFMDIEEKYNIEIKDVEADELWDNWFGDKYEVTWKRSYIQDFYDSIKNDQPRYATWTRWAKRWLRDYDRKNNKEKTLIQKIKDYVKL